MEDRERQSGEERERERVEDRERGRGRLEDREGKINTFKVSYSYDEFC